VCMEEAFVVSLLPTIGASPEDQWSDQVQPDGVGHERHFLPCHLCSDDILKRLRLAATAIFARPSHAEITGLVDLALPVAQKLELLIGADLHEGFRQQEIRLWRTVGLEPRF